MDFYFKVEWQLQPESSSKIEGQVQVENIMVRNEYKI